MIDTLLSSTLNDSEISHEEFTNIINEVNIYENIKENIKELTTEPTAEPSALARSSLERMTEPITKEKLTTLYKSCNILLMFKIITCTYKIF